MIPIAGAAISDGRGCPPLPSATSSISSSSLSPLASPFTVDRSLPASMNPSTLPLPPPAEASIASPHIYPSTAQSSSAYSSSEAVAPYFNSSGETAWSSPAAASSRLSTLNFGLRSVEAAPYYRYCASLSDSVEDPFEQVPDYNGYPGAYGTFDAEEGRPSRGSRVASSWMDLLLVARCRCHPRVQTEDGYLLTLQRIPHGKSALRGYRGPPVLLQHGLFQGGDTWFLNSVEESLGFLLADHGFDVWVGNVRGSRWSCKHIIYSHQDRAFWDWSWQELAQYDLAAMLSYVQNETSSKVLYIGHSQGTIMALAAFTMPDVVKMVEAAALLCPISYLNHISSNFVLRTVNMHIDQSSPDASFSRHS